jgi:RAT1-interacting protein
MPESSARSRDAVSGSSDVLSSSNRGRRKRARAADDVTGPSLLGFVQVDVRSLDAAAVHTPKYEEPLECGQVRANVSRACRRARRVRERATTAVRMNALNSARAR